MKTIRIFLLLFLTAFAVFTAKSQNLVLNPSFENINVSCSGLTGAGYVNLNNWYNPDPTDTCSTPDWFSTCLSTFFPTHAPNSALGNQNPRTGQAYAGFIPSEGNIDNYREYVEGELSTPMVAGQTYCVKFYISLADNVLYSCDRIGVYFANSLVQFPVSHCVSQVPLPYTPQLQAPLVLMTDKINWVKLQWNYTATGGEKFFVIGNFFMSSATTTSSAGGSFTNPFAYYFIDDVSIAPGPCCTINVASSQATDCSGNASITLNASGASAPYSYNWSTGATTQTVTGLAPGTYTVSVTDNTGCTQDTSLTVGTYTPLSATVTTTPTCSGSNSGIAAAVVSGGTAPYTYSWSPGGASTAIVNGLAAGTYTATVTDNNGCSVLANGTVGTGSTATFSVNANATTATCGANNGTATATITGGSGTFNYSWSTTPPQTTATATGLSPGTYTVAVTDAGGSVTSFYTEDFTSGGGTWNLTNSGPGTNGASANKWTVNNSNPLCTGGSGGNYLHISCLGGGFPVNCTQTDSHYETGVPFFVDNSTDKFASSPVISTLGRAGITLKFTYQCNGVAGSDYGLVRLSNDGGATWTDLPTQYSGVTTCTLASIAIPAIYENIANFKIAFRWINNSDNNGNDAPFAIDDVSLESAGAGSCAVTAIVTVNSTSTLAINTTNIPATCGSNNGSATATPSGGSGTYTYSWSTTPAQTTATATNLAAGTYTVTISDGSCSLTSTATISNSGGSTLAISAQSNILCFGTANGSATITASAGSSPYDFVWTGTGGTVHTDNNITTPSTASGLTAGTYTVSVTDNSGCISTQTVTITQPASATSVSTSAITNATCGSSNGAATIAASGGTTGYTYNWLPSGGTAPTASSLAAGTYTVTVTDANGCTATIPVIINNTGGPTVTLASQTNVNCNGSTTGSATVNATGGSGTYTYSWSGGAGTAATANNLAAGTYTVTVSDGSCPNSTIVTITQPNAISGSVNTTPTTCGNTTGTASVTATGGTGALSYVWNSGNTSASISNLAAGAYSVVITDAAGCTHTASGIVSSIGGPTANAGSDVIIIAGDNTILNGTGTSGATFNWSPGATLSCTGCANPVATPAQTTTYTLTVTQNGCTAVDEVTVTVDVKCGELFVPTAFSPNDDGENDVIQVMGNCIEDLIFTVYDRWGEAVFQTTDPTKVWNGTYKGKKLDAAVFAYYLQATVDGIQVKKHGNITLVK